MFAIGADAKVYRIAQKTSGGGWTDWEPLGGEAMRISVARNADGRFEIFVVGSDHNLWHIWETQPGSTWSNWEKLGIASSATKVKELSATVSHDGRLHVFYTSEFTDANGSVTRNLQYKSQAAAGGAWNQAVFGIGIGEVTQFSIGKRQYDIPSVALIEAFFIKDGKVWRAAQEKPEHSLATFGELPKQSGFTFVAVVTEFFGLGIQIRMIDENAKMFVRTSFAYTNKWTDPFPFTIPAVQADLPGLPPGGLDGFAQLPQNTALDHSLANLDGLIGIGANETTEDKIDMVVAVRATCIGAAIAAALTGNIPAVIAGAACTAV